MKQRAFSILGNIAIVNFSDNVKSLDKIRFANKILKDQKQITTVLEKSGNFKGRLRKMETKHLAGEKTKEVLYRENGCVFRFNVDTTYFSPRLSNERNEIAKKIKKGENVLVMFAGVAPFSIVIGKNSKAKKIYSNEINREANKYAKMNIERNKLKDKIELVSGDIKRLVRQNKLNNGFDVIVMPRPRLKETFLKEAFALSKKNTRIYYYDFCRIGEERLIARHPAYPSVQDIGAKIKSEAKKAKKKIKILNVKHAGEIAPYKVRVRIDFEVL